MKHKRKALSTQTMLSIELWSRDGKEKLIWHDVEVMPGDTVELQGVTVQEIVNVDGQNYGPAKMAAFEVPFDGIIKVRLWEER